MSLSDAELLAAINARDPDAFDAFVERYGRRVLAFGLRMCGQREDAEDVFQDTLLTAYEGLTNLRDPGAVRTWLFRVVSNACLMKRRKVPPQREVPLESFRGPDREIIEPLEIPDGSKLPDDEAARAELHQALEEAIAALPPEMRIVVLLRDVEGLSTRETAEALEIGQSAVKMRLHRARLALREALELYEEEASQ